MKKKLLFVGGIAVITVAVVMAIIICTKQNKNMDGITRYEWIQMLTEKFGMNEYNSDTPYFKDVTPDNQYFSYVQTAYEWGILEEDSSFCGDKAADGEFVALTAMRTVGKYKIQMYLGIPDEPKNNDYLKLALENELLTKSQLSKRISKEDSEVILKKTGQFYLSNFWRDDYFEIKYQEGVKELEGEEILSVNDEESQIAVLSETVNTLAKSDIIIFTNPVTGKKLAKRIVNIRNNGIIELENTNLDNVINSMKISDISSVSTDEIFNVFSSNQDQAEVQTLLSDNNDSVMPVFYKEGSGHSNGVSISVEADNEEFNIIYTNNDTGITCEFPIQEKLQDGGSINATVNVSRIDAGVEIYYTLGGLEYLNAQIESDIEFSGEITVNAEKKIKIGEVPILLAGGVAEIDLQLFLVFSIDGSISLQAEIPAQFAVDYTRNAGVRSYADVQINPVITADCSSECNLIFAPGIAVLGYDIFSIETGIGVSVEAEIVNRLNSYVNCCAELSVSAPIIDMAVVFNDDISDILDSASEFLDINVPLEWEIMTKENAIFHKELHYEWYSDGTSGFVDKCTYQEENASVTGQRFIGYDTRMAYCAIFTSDFSDEGDFYVASGKLYGQIHILPEELKQLHVGDVYNFYGHEFIYEGEMTYRDLLTYEYYFNMHRNESEEFAERKVSLFTDADNRKYYVINDDEDDMPFYSYYTTVNNMNNTSPNLWDSRALIDDSYTFKINKHDLYISKDKDKLLSEIENVNKSAFYSVTLYKDGSMAAGMGECAGGGEVADSIAPTISLTWEDEVADDGISAEEAKELCMELMINLAYDTPESTMAFFDKNGDYSIDADELKSLWYWTVDNYNLTDKNDLSEDEKIAIGNAVYNKQFKTPDSLFDPFDR